MAWSTQTLPGDVRALRASQLVRDASGAVFCALRDRSLAALKDGRAATRSNSYARERMRVKKSEPDGLKKSERWR